jgi:hypothetical protein
MSAIAEKISGVRLGEPQKHRNLTMVPLLAEGPDQPEYRLLDDALATGCARVTEVSDAGSVPELKFVNECDRPVLLLDGEELIGAKQNRILNLTVLAPAHKTIVIPVSCVEAGRWQAESTDFASARRTHYAAGRARKAAQVSESLRATGSRRSDQAAVWGDISAKAARMQAFSETDAAAAMYETHRGSLDAYLQAFRSVPGQSGAMFAVNGNILGLDLFNSPATLAAVLSKLVESFALDAIDNKAVDRDVTSEEMERFLEETAMANVEPFPAVGEGEDLRLQGGHLTGGALVNRGRAIHICVFRVEHGQEAEHERRGRMARASRRRRTRA